MDNLSEDVRADFLNGSNGAVVSFFFFKKNCPLILLCIHVTYSNLVKQYHSKVSWQSWLKTWNSILASQKWNELFMFQDLRIQFRQTFILNIHHVKGFRENDLFLERHRATIRIYRQPCDMYMSCIRFLGDKKRTNGRVFELEFRITKSLYFYMNSILRIMRAVWLLTHIL